MITKDLQVIVATLLFLFFFSNQTLWAQQKPNIVWLVTEDNSKHFLKLYNEGGASMPTIERLAKHGLLFKHAFSQAPVCSVARSTIISGCLAPRVGTQYHRRMEFAPMPEGLEMFPSYLRKAGYYTTNNSKEDYNFLKSDEVWDMSSNKATYKDRKEGQPFFHVQNFGITHEGRLHFTEQQMRDNPTTTDPKAMKPFPYHPDTPTFRYTYARYHDNHQRADEAMGQFIKQLEEDGLMDDTFIFYYGDHGGVLPGSKGYIYESGLHVPMVVYIPEKWKHLAPAPAGSSIDGFVRFIDLAPTVLNLAGVAIPDQIDGEPFLGRGVDLPSLNQRDVVFSYADRFDEKYDLVRALRKGKYKYMRNFQPFNFDGLYNFYRYKMLAYKEWNDLYKAGKLNAAQRSFFESRPPECLYDLEKDPYEVNNLAADPAYAKVVKQLRKELNRQLKSMPDLSFYPENHFIDKGIKNPVQFGQENKKEIAKLIKVANLNLKPLSKAKAKIEKALNSSNPWQRYWALIVCSSYGEEAAQFFGKAKQMATSDPENLLRARAAEFLGLSGAADPSSFLVDCVKNAKTSTEANLVLNTIALLHDVKPAYKYDLRKDMVDPAWIEDVNDLVARRLEYLGTMNYKR